MLRLVTAALALTLVAQLAPNAGAPANAGPRRTAALVIEGRGYGHGRGMGQYGALGMARAGAPWQRILRHYYRGARIDRRDPGSIRVLIRSSRALRLSGELEVRASGETARASWVRVRRAGSTIVVARARTHDGPWQRVTRTRAAVTIRGRGPVWLGEGGSSYRGYAGAIEVRRRAGALAAINVVGMGSYVASVTPREMPASWNLDALRAQAVAARTYAVRVRRVARARGSSYDICATTACQVYGGVASRSGPYARATPLLHPRAARAVRDTAGRVLVWGGEPILAQYASSTGGWTEYGGVPYLRAVRDRGDRLSPYHHWRVRVGAGEIEAAYPSIGALRTVAVVRRNGRGAWGGRARVVEVRGTARTVRTSGDGFASELGLRSDWFRVAGRATAPAGAFLRDLGYGMRHPDVRRLQLRLRREHVYPRSAPVTGYFGPITRDAVRRYQRTHDIVSTGFVGPITRARLNGVRYRYTSDVGIGTRSPVVRELKHRLRNIGFFPYRSHSQRFGEMLKASVARYQRAHSISPTGYVGPLTRRSLNRR